MTPLHQLQGGNSPANFLVFTRRERRSAASYERALPRQEIRPLDGRARSTVPQCRQDQLVRSQAVFRELFALREEAVKRIACLTPRQQQVMDLVLAGYANKNIAWELSISQRTAENHRFAVMKKTGTKSLPALARLALAAACDGAGDAGGEVEKAIGGAR